MTLRPTEKAQKEWLDKYFNGGCCPPQNKYHETLSGTACYNALVWLAESEVYCLADAWQLCDRLDWLFWMLSNMKPHKKDIRLGLRFFRRVVELAQKSPLIDQKKLAAAIKDEEEGWGDSSWEDELYEARDILTTREASPAEIEDGVHACYAAYECFVNDAVFYAFKKAPFASSKKFKKQCADLLREVFGNPWEM
jgi:hypothetical protein